MSNPKQLIFAFFLYLFICIVASIVVEPFSVISFIGPAAATASALMLISGAITLVPIIISTFVFSVFLSFYHGYNIELSIVIISLLAVILQAFWTKQLAYKYTRDQAWLNSRAILLTFLMKIGPVASIVSASATLLVTVLDAQVFTNSLTYAFISSWTSSLLVIFFLAPTLLFLKKEQKLTFAKRAFVIFSSFLGTIAIVLLFMISQKAHQHQRDDHFSSVNAIINKAIESEIASLKNQLTSLTAFYDASTVIEEHEFTAFSKSVYDDASSVSALTWVPIVDSENQEKFETFASEHLKISYKIGQSQASWTPTQHENSTAILPIFYRFPLSDENVALGENLNLFEESSAAVELATISGQLVATAPLLFSQSDTSHATIFVLSPVAYSNTLNAFGKRISDTNVVSGYVVAIANFNRLFEQISAAIDGMGIKFSVADVTSNVPYHLFGEQGGFDGKLSETLTINIFTRNWQVVIYEDLPWKLQPKTWQVWSLLIGGSLGGMCFQLLILMMAAYSTELSNKVIIKTRELILAKDQSDQANAGKTKFIETLAIECQSSVDVIHAYAQQAKLSDKSLDKDVVNGVENVAKTLGHLVNNLNDLSSIEAGELNIEPRVIDLHDLVTRLESMLKATADAKGQSLTVVMGNNLPQFIEADEYRIQQLVSIISSSAFAILQSNDVRLSIKAHLHKVANTSLFFVLTVGETEYSEPNSLISVSDKNDLFESHSTSMAMVKELCQLLGGDAAIVNLPSGEVLINASIKVNLPTVRNTYNKTPKYLVENEPAIKKVIVLSDNDSLISSVSTCAEENGYESDVCRQHHEMLHKLRNTQYSVLIIDGDDKRYNAISSAALLRKNEQFDALHVIGVFKNKITNEQLFGIRSSMNGYLELPIDSAKLKHYFQALS